MSLRAVFIGIDKYVDPSIRDLNGARNDAVALWALFKDTFADGAIELLTDADATSDVVRAALRTTLLEADADDTVVVFFAGHGTRDHRLVPHNAAHDSLTASTVPMQDIAECFKASPAKQILCLLDCCFSGGVTARVIEDSPATRDPVNPLTQLEGTGRIVIAASAIDEPAYELPGNGHGILTKALIDTLEAIEEEQGILAVTDSVLARVRAEAARIGVTQTPAFLGDIKGGLTLPRFVRGAHFAAAFPDRQGHQATTAIASLIAFGIPEGVIHEWAERFRGGLNQLQVDAINTGRILDGQSLLVISPTSSGKTFIGEMAAAKAVVDGRKAVFLLPYRALVNEKYDQFSALYGQQLGMRVIRCTGDYADQVDPFVRGKYDLGLLTYEMFLRLAVSQPQVLNQIELVVLDEAQFITDPMRGISVELILTYLIAVRERGISPQLIALSAVIGDSNNFPEWLGCRALTSTYRPVPLKEGVLDRTGVFQCLEPDGTITSTQMLPRTAIRVRRDQPSSQDVVVPLVQKLVADGQKVIVFRNIRGKAEGCANYLAADLGLPAATEALEALPVHDLSDASTRLRRALEGGTAFHNSNLNRDERAVVERVYRDPNSRIRVLAATTTVAAGINTPASTVILAEKEFVGDEGRPFTVAEYKNMAGRAGRLGFNEQGTSIILADTGIERQQLFRKYVQGQLDRLSSSFDMEDFDTWVLRLIAQVPKVLKADVVRLLANTYGGYLSSRRRPEWIADMTREIERLIDEMIRLELLEVDDAFIRLTPLGRACGSSQLKFRSAIRFISILSSLRGQTLTADQLLALVQILPEADGGYTPMMRRGQREQVRANEAAARYGADIVRLLQRQVEDNFEYLARCKRAALLWDWIGGVALDQIETTYSGNVYQGRIGHGDVRRFADNTRSCLRSAYEIVALMFLDGAPDGQTIENLITRLEVGVPAAAIPLLPLGLSRGEYLQLVDRGIQSIAQFWGLSATDLSQILGPLRGAQMELRRPPAE